MNHFLGTRWIPLVFTLLLSSVAGGLFAQTQRMVGVLVFQNQGDAAYDWVGRGIEELLYSDLREIHAIQIYEKETLNRLLTQLKVEPSSRLTARHAFSIGKFSGIEVLFTGTYRVSANQLSLIFRLYSTYTGSPILEATYTGPLSEIFSLVAQGVREAMQVMEVPLSQAELRVIERRPTASMEAFQNYCKAYVEIARGAPMEVIAGYFLRAIQEDPDYWEAQYNLGVIYYNFDLYDKALQQFQRVIERNPGFYKAHYGKGIIHYIKHQYSLAIDEFERVLQIEPEHDRSYYYLGLVYSRIDSLKKAVAYYDKAIALNSSYPPAYFQKGLTLIRMRRFQDAITSLKTAVKLNPDYYQAHNALGEAYYALNLFEEAIIEFKKAVAVRPQFSRAYFNLGNAYYRQGALAEIVSAFWSLIEISPNLKGLSAPPGSEAVDFQQLREKAQAVDSTQTLRRMAENYKRALQYNTDFYQAAYNLGLTYEHLHKPDSAKMYYLKAIRIREDLPQAHMRLAKLYEREGKYPLALSEYKKVAVYAPGYWVNNPRLGEPYRYVNVLELVLNEYQRRLDRNPRDKEALKVVGRIYYSLGRWGQAETYYEQLVAVSPDDRGAARMLQEIRRKLRKM